MKGLIRIYENIVRSHSFIIGFLIIKFTLFNFSESGKSHDLALFASERSTGKS